MSDLTDREVALILYGALDAVSPPALFGRTASDVLKLAREYFDQPPRPWMGVVIARPGEERWETARRVVSNDHPEGCPCIRDHLETAFLLGMGEGRERAHAEPPGPPSSTGVQHLGLSSVALHVIVNKADGHHVWVTFRTGAGFGQYHCGQLVFPAEAWPDIHAALDAAGATVTPLDDLAPTDAEDTGSPAAANAPDSATDSGMEGVAPA